MKQLQADDGFMADLRKGKEPFGTLDVLVTAPAPNVVRYEAEGSFATTTDLTFTNSRSVSRQSTA